MMAKARAKQAKKQAEEAVKDMYNFLSGRIKLGFLYERPKKRSQANRIGGSTADDAEKEVLTEKYLRLLRFMLSGIMAELSLIEDPRQEGKIKHALPILMLYGILMFLFHIPSRRAANRSLGGSQAADLIREYVPNFTSMPHADTLERLLQRIEGDELEKQYEKLLKEFLKSDTFLELNPGRMLVACDGTGKFSRDWCWDERALNRNAGDPDKERYYVYMMESVLILDNGMVLPLLTETLENGKNIANEKDRQDCELEAFKRLAVRLEKLLGKGRVTLLLDGLYPSGPIISTCIKYGWEYMISLKKDSLKSVWEDFEGLQKIEQDNVLEAKWGERVQQYRWSNGIEYIYGSNNKVLSLNLVTCMEIWYEESARKGKPEFKKTEYAWLSSSKLTVENVFERCTLIARRRWRLENNFHVEKHDGYSYEHCFSYNWNAMKGYHCLMKFAHFLNTFIVHSELIANYVVAESVKGLIEKVWTYICSHGISALYANAPPRASGAKRHRRRKIRFKDLRLIKTKPIAA